MVANALEAQAALKERGVGTRVGEIHTVKPLDGDFVRRMARETGVVVTVEEHSIIGGLGSAVCEALADVPGIRIARVGLQDTFAQSGTIENLHTTYGLDPASIAATVEQVLSARTAP
jgi:transketolase